MRYAYSLAVPNNYFDHTFLISNANPDMVDNAK